MDARLPADQIPPAPAPWLNLGTQQRVAWRDGDIVISVPMKSGTTWTMNIVHQLRTGGDSAFEDIYVEVPWLEIVLSPETTPAELVARIDALPADRRRAFKTHSPPPLLPFIETEAQVKYVVVVRNPEEATVSFRPFIERHRSEWFELWTGSPDNAMVRDSFADYYRDVALEFGVPEQLFGFMASWWALREHPKVLLLHFADLKRDHEGSLRTIAEFLGFEPREDQWPAILEYTSFAWMKAHEHKFEARLAAAIPILERGGMLRQGKVGVARAEGMDAAIAADLAARGREILTDEAAFRWFYEGGPLP